jgi:copper transport protein
MSSGAFHKAARRAAATFILWLGAGGLAPAAAWPEPPAAPPHAHLLSSEPAAGATVRSIERVTLTFSEPLEASFNRIELVGPDGSRVPLAATRDPRNARRLLADAPTLGDGAYRLEWRVISADGHTLSGEIAFAVEAAGGEPGGRAASFPATPGAASAPASGTRRAPAGTGVDRESRTPVSGQAPLATPAASNVERPQPRSESGAVAAVARGAALTALAALAGLLAMLGWFTSGSRDRLGRVVAPLGVLAAFLLGVDQVLWMKTVSDGPLDLAVLAAALHTRIGVLGAARVAFVLLALVLWLRGRRQAPAAVAALLAVTLTGALGHPSAIDPALSIPANAIHLLAVSLWMGGLLTLVLASGSDPCFREDALRVSRVALAAVVVIALTGALQVLLFLPSPRDLLESSYGLLVLGKLTGLGVLVAFGARNRFRLLPPLSAGGPPSPLRRSVRAETVVMAAVILLAAFLGYVPPPEPAVPVARAVAHDAQSSTPR